MQAPHNPVALRSAAFTRSCQPGPSIWKCASTSWSIRNVTDSLAPGTKGGPFGTGAGSVGFVVAALNAASAASRASTGLRLLLGAMKISFRGAAHGCQGPSLALRSFKIPDDLPFLKAAALHALLLYMAQREIQTGSRPRGKVRQHSVRFSASGRSHRADSRRHTYGGLSNSKTDGRLGWSCNSTSTDPPDS